MIIATPLILDGACGTEIIKRGYDGTGCSEKWIQEHRDVMLSLQREYIEAGSQVIYTPTFGVNRAKLKAYGLQEQTIQMNMELADISLEAAAGKALVAGDIAPTGIFPWSDEWEDTDLKEIYLEQAHALETAGVDLFVVETMMSIEDAKAAVGAVKAVSGKPVMVSCTCDDRGRMLDGTDIVKAMEIMTGLGIDAFGLNCSQGPAGMLRNILRLMPYASVPVLAKPNAGMPHVADGKTVYDCGPEEFGEYIGRLLDAGVSILGGCCGTDSRYIREIKRKIG